MTTVYKSVNRENDGLYSTHAQGKYRTRYTPEERVEKTNIFVFTDQDEAQAFLSYAGIEIWECETDSDPRSAPIEVPDFDYTQSWGYNGVTSEEADKLISRFWDSPYRDRHGPLSLIGTPDGTYLVNDVKLVRQVY